MTGRNGPPRARAAARSRPGAGAGSSGTSPPAACAPRETTCRRSAWKIWAGVVRFTTRQLSSTDSSRNRSSRAEECSGPCPSMPCGSKSTRPGQPVPLRLGRGEELVDEHLGPVHEVAELRLPDRQPLGHVQAVAVLEPQGGRLGEQAVADLDRPLPLPQVRERGVGRAALVSYRTAWRWLKVPRRVSWPTRRTRVPSQSQGAVGERLAHAPVERRCPRAHLGSRLQHPRQLGVDVEALAAPARAPARPRGAAPPARRWAARRRRAVRPGTRAQNPSIDCGEGRAAMRAEACVGLLQPRPVGRGHASSSAGPTTPSRTQLARRRAAAAWACAATVRYITGWVKEGSSPSLCPCRR